MTMHDGRFGSFDRHFWLTRSVARTIGVNLSDAMQHKRLTADDYEQMVDRCRRCGHAHLCERWLAAHGAGRAEAAPPHCRIATELNRLR